MDTLGCRGSLLSPRVGGVLYRLATLGSREFGHRNADRAVSFHERRACGCSRNSCKLRLETPYAQPDHSSRDSGQRDLLPYTAHDCAAPTVPWRLYCCASLPALFLVGIRGSEARWCSQTRDCRSSYTWHADDDLRRSGGEMVVLDLAPERLNVAYTKSELGSAATSQKRN